MKRENKIQLIFISILAAILPLIVYLKVIPLPKGSIAYLAWPVSDMNYDFFSYYKTFILKGFTAVILIVTAIMKWKKIRWKNYYIFIFIYIMLIALSTFFSPFPSLAVQGVADRYEGMAVLIAYLVIFFIVINSLESKKEFKLLIGALVFSSTIVAVIGIFQYFGLDLFRSDFGKKMILPLKYENLMDNMKFQFGKYTIYSTLYNTNFVGSFMIMFFFLGLGMYLYSKDRISIVFWAIYTLLIFSNQIGCRSRAGLMGFIITIILFLILYRKKLKTQLKKISILFFGCIIIFLIMNYTSKTGSSLIENYSRMQKKDLGLRDLYVEKDRVFIVHKDAILTIKNINNQNLKFYDSQNNILKVKVRKGIITFNDNRYKEFKFRVTKSAVNFMYGSEFNYLLILKDNTFKTVNSHGKIVDIVKVKRFKLFDGREKMGSFRLYNWSRTIPLLKNTLLLGYGPDTFSIVFPQYDYFGKMISYGNKGMIVDKPHNMYLQIAVNTGVLSMVNLIIFILWYFYNFLSTSKRKLNKSFYTTVSFFSGLSVFGYLVSALFNDSLVSVAPIFWIVWGISIAAIRKNNKIFDKKKIIL